MKGAIRMSVRLKLSAALAGLVCACGSSMDSTTATGPTGSTGTTGSTSFNLTLSNFEAWCAITVTQPAGTTLPAGASGSNNVVAFPSGTVVKLHGEPASSYFEWAPSTGHGGWSGAIDPGQDPISKDITVTLTENQTVNVCCPFTNGSGCP